MKRLLLFGAGKSATCLIEYLLKQLKQNDWYLVVCDADIDLAKSKIGNAENASGVSINVENEYERRKLVEAADIVISMLPPTLHFLIAKDCIEYNKNLLTASYIDDSIKSLEKEISSKNLLFLCEMGLDPGIDHMSAMKMISTIKNHGGVITSFKSHCGGLIAPESDDNPWHYKITWNPRNIVLAGRDGAEYLNNNQTLKITYTSIFSDCPLVHIIDNYPLCWYPNRDSLPYIDLYKLQGVSTFIRTTLRHPAFCDGWNKFVNLGLTDTSDNEQIKHCKTFKEWMDVKRKLCSTDISNFKMNISHQQISCLKMESNEMLPDNFKCSADILQYVLEDNLSMKKGDKDMIVMLHEMEYTIKGQSFFVNSSLVVKGEDTLKTAMAKTVGLPLGIAAKLILQDKIKISGLHIPIIPEIYEPVLNELEKNGIKFNEETSSQ